MCTQITYFSFSQDLGSKDINADAYLVAHIVRVGEWQLSTNNNIKKLFFFYKLAFTN